MEDVDTTQTIKELLTDVECHLAEVRRREEKVKEELMAKLAELSAERERFEAQQRHLQALLVLRGDMTEAINTSNGSINGSIPLQTVRRLVPLGDEVYNLLQSVGRELHYKEIADRLLAQGVDMPGKDPASSLVARIHEDPRFVRPRRGVYALKKWYPKGFVSVGTRKRAKSPRRSRKVLQS